MAAVLAEAIALLDSVIDIAGPDVAEDRRRLDAFRNNGQAIPLNDAKAWVASWGSPNELPRPPAQDRMIVLSPDAVDDVARLRSFLNEIDPDPARRAMATSSSLPRGAYATRGIRSSRLPSASNRGRSDRIKNSLSTRIGPHPTGQRPATLPATRSRSWGEGFARAAGSPEFFNCLICPTGKFFRHAIAITRARQAIIRCAKR